MASVPVRARHALNPAQQAAFEQIRDAILARQFRTFLLHGVTGSGKTEVYLTAIEAVLAQGRSALLLVPEIALTPAMAGQFFLRFGDRVAILHSAFTDVERTEQWRRIRSGKASVVVGTRSGVFAPVRDLGLIVVDEEHDGSYKQEETPRYNGRDVAMVRAQAAGACVVLGSATPSLESRYNAERGKYTLLELPGRVEERPMPMVELMDMRQEFLETRKQATFSRKLMEAIGAAPGKRRADHRAAEPARLFQFRGVPLVRRARGVHELFGDPDLSQARPAPAVPLLRLRREGPAALPEVRERAHLLPGAGVGASGGGTAPRLSDSPHRAPGPRHRNRQAAVRDHSARFSRGQLRHSGGHADDRQRARYSQRHAGGRGVGGRGAGRAGFSRGRAHLSTADAGGGARRARQPCRGSC